MQTGKRIVSIFLIVLLLLTAAPLAGFVGLEVAPKAQALAETGQCGDNVTWSFNSSTGALTISGTGSMTDYTSYSSPFYNSREIKSVTINSGVTSIGSYAFNYCKALTSVTIPDSVTSIGNSAFSYCKALTSVNISDVAAWCGITFSNSSSNPLYYAKNLYLNGELVNELTIPDSVTSIGNFAFEYCTALTSVTIGNSVTSIGSSAFYYCTALMSVTIPSSVRSLGLSAFLGCTGLTQVHITDLTAWCEMDFPSWDAAWGNSTEGNPLYYAHNLYLNDMLVTDIIIPESVTDISDQAFRFCTSLKNVRISDGVRDIGHFAFAGCSNLTSVEIPNSVTSIGIHAFEDCKSLTSIEIPNRVREIKHDTFSGCNSLTNVTIPNSVTIIGSDAFSGCRSLANVTIPDRVTSIGFSAFFNCDALESIVIPDSVIALGPVYTSYSVDGVFGYCDNLKTVTIGNSLTKIYDYTFYRCDKLETVTIGSSVTSIGNCAFYNCNALTSVTIPDSVTSIGNSAFYNCTALKDVYYTGTEEQWNQISISSGNTALTQATIHYESSEEGPIEKLGIDNDVNESVEFGSSKSVGVELNRSWFSQSVSNKRYHHGLARFCSAFSMLGYSSSKKITSYLQQCGFDILEYTENGKKVKALNMDTGRDEVNTFIAAKRITIDGAKKNLIFVGTIGSNDNQWYSDFDPYGKDREEQTPKTAFEDTHLGFADARDYAYGMLKNALEANGLDQQADDNILLFTGHSRGAATANILAAKVIDEGIWANQKSIYAYTFATPNSIDASKKTDLHDYKYLSIFNIVNPEDFVTKVMLKGWGYDRYGQTFVLPSKTNTSPSTYKNQLSSMRYYYSRFSAGGTYHPFSLGEESTWSAVIWMKLHVPTVDAFYRTKFSYTLPLYWVSPYEFFKDSLLVCLAKEELVDKLPGITKLLLVMENPCAISFYQPLILYFANLSPEYFISLGAEELANVMNVSDFANAHAADTYCAYMYALSENEVTISKTSYIGSVNCPVDVEIIDKTTDEVVGRIVDNVVDEEIFAKENSVVMTVDGDKKSFWLPSDSDYEVKLIGNDRGTMDYMLSEIDSDIGELGRTNFFDVPLTGGLTYTSDVGKEDFSLSEYTLTREDGTVIQPDETFDAENMTKYSVTVSADENGTAGSDGTYTSGDYATVYAFPNEGCEFDGWYTDETCVSSEATYRFRVDSDVTLTAKFKQHEHVYESAITTAPTCSTDGETTYTCTVCGDTYTEPIPATGNHADADNDGHCDTCEEMMRGGDHCKYCGKIHDGFFGWLVKFFHSIFAIFKR